MMPIIACPGSIITTQPLTHPGTDKGCHYILLPFNTISARVKAVAHQAPHAIVGIAIKRVVASGRGTLLLSEPVFTTTSSPLKETAKRSALLGAGPSRYSPSTL